jgi:hypothetical protein
MHPDLPTELSAPSGVAPRPGAGVAPRPGAGAGRAEERS